MPMPATGELMPRRASLMGPLANRRLVAFLAGLVTALIVGLNVYLLLTAA